MRTHTKNYPQEKERNLLQQAVSFKKHPTPGSAVGEQLITKQYVNGIFNINPFPILEK